MNNGALDIVIIANIEWKFLKQRHQFLAEYLSDRGHNVIFVESSAKRNPGIKDIPRIYNRLFGKKLKNETKSSSRKVENVKVITPIVLPSTNFIFNLINDLVFTKKLAKKITSNLVNKNCIILNYLPSHTSLSLSKLINYDAMVYDCVSNFEFVPGMPDDVVDTENKLIELSSAVLYDCNFLLEKHAKKSKKNFLVPPGVEFSKFDLKLETKRITKILYFGLLSEKNDLEILKKLSQKFELFLIGEYRTDPEETSRIFKSIFPPVDNEKLPDLIKNYDALVLPYRLTNYAKGVIPAKFFECLATGLPVIATRTPNFLEYSQQLLLVDNDASVIEISEFIDNVDLRTSRVNLARDNDWKSKAELLEGIFYAAI